MKTAETIMSFSHDDPEINQSPLNSRLNHELEIDKRAVKIRLTCSTFSRDKGI